ncbi:flagellar hook-basal body complex protein FliE [Actinoplanes ianthinogenes]|uniref:Flagellar hook-basal body complex protein FliE n=1 Tax=Actinoplanes ianthinogenes TaxID=122358 RepID=A0ABN6CFJ7_9ACTN|nr:flagellar hook-basal body complex protein FliE [Actinoplanes ianthinogenes]BCJ43107.1 flagellar hook-basal body complex protein FliE [Actinoplanes ianthinogenes]GGQ90190.1 flagellar hook-basal body complex protein FliE [Actinoplanes ianthinogenes]
MTSAINPIGGLSGFSGISGISGMSGISDNLDLDEAAKTASPNTDFARMLSKGLESVQASQTKASDLAVQVANGQLQDPAQYTMAATEASLGLQMTLAVRNKAVEAFQEIMRMQA